MQQTELEKRRERADKIFGASTPTASSVTPLQKCAEYWAIKQIQSAQRLQPERRLLAVVPLGFEGIARMKKIFADFNGLRDSWESYQTKVFGMFCNAMVRHILDTDTDRCLEMVMAQNHWTEIPSEVLVLAYRGAGKTIMMIDAQAAFIANIRGYTACVYAGTKTKAQDFYNGIVEHALKLISRMDPSKRPKVQCTHDILQFTFPDGDTRWIRPFSSIGMVSVVFSFFCFFSLSPWRRREEIFFPCPVRQSKTTWLIETGYTKTIKCASTSGRAAAGR
jgi:hypothetical protein